MLHSVTALALKSKGRGFKSRGLLGFLIFFIFFHLLNVENLLIWMTSLADRAKVGTIKADKVVNVVKFG